MPHLLLVLLAWTISVILASRRLSLVAHLGLLVVTLCGMDRAVRHLIIAAASTTPPWFYKQLPQPTTDAIQMRVCRNEDADNEDIAIEMIEIYVR